MATARWRRRALTNAALGAVSALLGLAALEAVLRVRAEPAPPTQPDTWLMATMPLHRLSADPVLRYEVRPGAVVEHAGVVYRINAQGLRDDEDVGAKPPGQRRILLVGDSIAFGLGVPREATFARQLEVELSTGGRSTRVMNLSVLGYGTAQEVRLLERDGLPLQPDIVVVVFCLNDFEDYSRSLTAQTFALPGAERVRLVAPRRFGNIVLPEPLPLIDQSLLLSKVANRLLRPDYYRWIGTDPARRATVATALDQLGQVLTRQGIPGLVVVVPLLSDASRYPYDDIHQFVAARAAAAGLAVVDLRAALQAEGLPALRLSPDDVLHLNVRGHAVAARALAPCLADQAFRCELRVHD